MVEANPWWRNLPENATLPACYGATGVKADGGGSMAGRGRVGPMRLHRAANLRDAAALKAALAAGDDVNEVESVRPPPPRQRLQRAQRASHGLGARGQRCARCALRRRRGRFAGHRPSA